MPSQEMHCNRQPTAAGREGAQKQHGAELLNCCKEIIGDEHELDFHQELGNGLCHQAYTADIPQ